MKKILLKIYIKKIDKKIGFIERFKNAARVLYTFKFQLNHDLHNSHDLSIA